MNEANCLGRHVFPVSSRSGGGRQTKKIECTYMQSNRQIVRDKVSNKKAANVTTDASWEAKGLAAASSTLPAIRFSGTDATMKTFSPRKERALHLHQKSRTKVEKARSVSCLQTFPSFLLFSPLMCFGGFLPFLFLRSYGARTWTWK